MSKPIWYEEGIKFKCTGCGKCCTGAPGYVWLTEEDIQRLCQKLNLSEKVFLKTYTRYIDGRYSLLEKPISYDCIFLKGKECSLYEARPKQCRKFPFWSENFASKEEWEEAGLSCEGIDHVEGRLFSKKEIEENLKS